MGRSQRNTARRGRAWAWAVAAAIAATSGMPAAARAGHGGFDVAFADCVESIGVDLVATDAARALVPAGFVLVGEGTPVTPIVVRTARCGRISIDGRRGRPGTIVQVGLVIVPPDSPGDIDNYTLWYYTSNPELAAHLRALGVDAQHVPTLELDYRPGAGDPPIPYEVVVPRPGDPALRLDGVVVPPGAPVGSFLANWWVATPRRVVKMATTVPSIAIGGADLVLRTRERGALGRLIGGDTLTFPILQQFNTFPAAAMAVDATPR